MKHVSKRPRGRNNGNHHRRNNSSNSNPNRAFESNGPGGKIRGTAAQLVEKYVQLARDAAGSGDEVRAENCRQHAEHYQRIINSFKTDQDARRTRRQPRNAASNEGGPQEVEASDQSGDAASGEEANAQVVEVTSSDEAETEQGDLLQAVNS